MAESSTSSAAGACAVAAAAGSCRAACMHAKMMVSHGGAAGTIIKVLHWVQCVLPVVACACLEGKARVV